MSDFVDNIISIASLLLLVFSFVFGLLLLLAPFLIVKFIFQRKLTWWIVLLCLIASLGIYQAEILAWWKYWEWVFMELGEAI